MQKHAKSRQTKDHKVVDISNESPKCKPCMINNVVINASHFCDNCDNNLCDECSNTHKSHKLTRNHKLIPIPSVVPQCEICESAGASSFCENCEDPELLCELCAEDHKSMKQNRNHTFSYDMTKFHSK